MTLQLSLFFSPACSAATLTLSLHRKPPPWHTHTHLHSHPLRPPPSPTRCLYSHQWSRSARWPVQPLLSSDSRHCGWVISIAAHWLKRGTHTSAETLEVCKCVYWVKLLLHIVFVMIKWIVHFLISQISQEAFLSGCFEGADRAFLLSALITCYCFYWVVPYWSTAVQWTQLSSNVIGNWPCNGAKPDNICLTFMRPWFWCTSWCRCQ